MPHFKFSIRTLLLVTVLFAFGAFMWTNPPENRVRIEVDQSGRIFLDGFLVDNAALASGLKRRQLWLSLWHREPHADVLLEKDQMLSTDPHQNFLPLIKTVKDSGFTNPTIMIIDDGAIQ